MVNHAVPHRLLPCRVDRSKIVQQAKVVLAEAQALAEQLDGSALFAEPPAEGKNAAVSFFAATGTASAFAANQS